MSGIGGGVFFRRVLEVLLRDDEDDGSRVERDWEEREDEERENESSVGWDSHLRFCCLCFLEEELRSGLVR